MLLAKKLERDPIYTDDKAAGVIAKAGAEAAQLRLSALSAAQTSYVATLIDAVATEAPLWCKVALQETDDALTALSTVVRMAEDVHRDIGYSLGVLGMLERVEGGERALTRLASTASMRRCSRMPSTVFAKRLRWLPLSSRGRSDERRPGSR